MLRLDHKPMPNIEIAVGDVLTHTGAGGRYSATVETRGRFWVKARQPTSSQNIAYWVGAERVVEIDGRSQSYVIDIDAARDYME